MKIYVSMKIKIEFSNSHKKNISSIFNDINETSDRVLGDLNEHFSSTE